jgi:hypothetical protein
MTTGENMKPNVRELFYIVEGNQKKHLMNQKVSPRVPRKQDGLIPIAMVAGCLVIAVGCVVALVLSK